jgi:tRNA modification GTPase
MVHPDDTICAIATAAGGAARGMVRVSGCDTLAIVAKLFEPEGALSILAVRQPTAIPGRVRMMVDRRHGLATATASSDETEIALWLPCDLFLWPTERSYTREPLAELHTIGSPPCLEAVLAAVCRAGARLAEPGEFTLRAFLAGRIDLTQAEAVLGVIDACDKQQLSGALAQLAGGLATPLQQLREDLLQLLAELEAALDFADEDIEFLSREVVRDRLLSAGSMLSRIARQMAARHTAGPAMRIALVGEPNAGKSSLFNALVARRGSPTKRGSAPAALVSPHRGTTRDYLTATIELDGIECELLDTAGAEPESPAAARTAPASRHVVELDAAAQALSAEQHARAAVRARCVDSAQVRACATLAPPGDDVIILTKADLARHSPRTVADRRPDLPVFTTSSLTGEGLDDLCLGFRRLLTHGRAAQCGQVVAATAGRCRESIRLAEAALRRAENILLDDGGEELVAAELRIALSELGKVVGAVYTDDLLDRIFSTFCIGK